MALKTRQQYMDSLRQLRPNIYKFGELIQDVTIHPATKRTVESHARGFDAAWNSEFEQVFTTKSYLTGETIHRFNSLMLSLEDIMANAKLKRAGYRLTGTCIGGLCVGWNAFNTMWMVTHEMDQELHTGYQERLKQWVLKAEQEGLVVAGALTDAKGNRSLKASQQPDLDTNLRVVKVREDGIIVRGAKVMICGVAAANEIFVLPGNGYSEGEEDYAISFVVPRDVEGLTIIETRRPSDSREMEEGFDIVDTGTTQANLYFQDVFVPIERVFMCREVKYSRKVVQYFTANYRACIGACVAGQGDVMIGAGITMARCNGLSAKTFMDKLVQMAVNNETTYGVGIGAMALGGKHASGVWLADSLMAHTNKVQVATLPYETKRLCQDIGGGIVETGCFPSYQDFNSLEIGELVRKYLKAGEPTAESRARAARLAEWLTLGAGVPGCMHGGGSPDGGKLVVRVNTNMEEYARYAQEIAGITEEIKEPGAKK